MPIRYWKDGLSNKMKAWADRRAEGHGVSFGVAAFRHVPLPATFSNDSFQMDVQQSQLI